MKRLESGSKTALYDITALAAPCAMGISVRLRFRTFPPYLLRAIHLDELIEDLVIFDMEITE